jgi:hypothetical protein
VFGEISERSFSGGLQIRVSRQRPAFGPEISIRRSNFGLHSGSLWIESMSAASPLISNDPQPLCALGSQTVRNCDDGVTHMYSTQVSESGNHIPGSRIAPRHLQCPEFSNGEAAGWPTGRSLNLTINYQHDAPASD